MSGICGLFYLKGQPAQADDINTMLERIRHRGPDSSGHWIDINIALGHHLLYNAPESLQEKQPLEDKANRFVITADARIDNRDELFSSLFTECISRKNVSDAELIMYAYEKWGKDCCSRLKGDFAFAIWDKRTQQLFCARDHMGVKPFYYYHAPGQLFAFASEIKALFGVRQISKEINEIKIGNYLTQVGLGTSYETKTFYKNIHALAPATHLTVRLRGCESMLYWSLKNKTHRGLNTDSDYIAMFEDVFTKAVQSRLRSVYPASSTLSGGVDSSSVSCIAERHWQSSNPDKLLHTIYADCNDVSTDEKEFVNTVLGQGKFKHDNVSVTSTLDSAFEMTAYIDRPVYMPTPSMFLAIVKAARKSGSRVLLTGHDGDTVVSHGGAYFTSLLLKKQFEHLKQVALLKIENQVAANATFRSKEQLIIDYVYPRILSVLQKHISGFDLFTYIQTLYHAQKNFSLSMQNVSGLLVKSIFQNMYAKKQYAVNPLIDKKFAQHLHLNDAWKQLKQYYRQRESNVEQQHIHAITGNNIINTCEHLNHTAASAGMDIAHPFLDKDVIELCVSAPMNLKFNEGMGRGLLRKSMKGKVPQQILDRKTKVDFTGFILKNSRKDKTKLAELLFDSNNDLFQYVDKQRTYKCFSDIYTTSMPLIKERYYYRLLLRTAYLSLWLNHTKNS